MKKISQYNYRIWWLLPAFVILAMVIFLTRYPSDRDTLKVFYHAGPNIVELLKTLEHFRKERDPLKYEAVSFLIRNMDLHYFREDSLAGLKLHWASQHPGLTIDEILEVEDSLDQLWSSVPEQFPSKKVRDCRHVTAKFLITHIDQAFQNWESSPWNDRFDFKEFCEFFLPYKTNLSKPEWWFEYYNQKYKWLLDSVSEESDLEKAILLTLEEIGPKLRWLTMNMGRIAGPVEIDTALVGDCQMLTDWYTMILRSIGIPVAKTRTPTWANAAAGHYVNVFKTEDGGWREFETVRNAGWRIPNWELTASKFWLHTWGKQEGSFRSIADQSGLSEEDIPPLLRPSNVLDVTDQIISTSDIKIQLTRKPLFEPRFVYLALYDDHAWHPIHWSSTEGQEANFSQMGNDVLYLPVYYKNNQSFPAGDPFTLSFEGDIQNVDPDTNQLIEIELDRVYPVRHSEMSDYAKKLLDGTFEASNDSLFLDFDTLHHITRLPECDPPFDLSKKGKLSYDMWWQDADVASGEQYRYLRFRAHSQKECSLGEIEVFDTGNEKIEVQQAYGPGEHPEHVCDGFPGQFYHNGKKGSWVAMDFGKPKGISLIRFIPRDVEPASIHPGEMYQLFYWKDEWILAMETRAAGKSIACRIHPNSLYVMENLDFDGVFRPFIYRNGRLEWY